MEQVRILLDAETPISLGANMIRDRSIHLTLAQEGKIISAMVFNSRQDVDALLQAIQAPFNAAEETTADTMSGADYIALIELRAAIVNYLVVTARPLPSMLTYQFAKSLPSLVISQRLYGDASYYDDIRNENKVVHPAFCPTIGQALSA
jgi:prophage DNA circulation protein